MHPVIFRIGEFELPTYGLFMALGALIGAWTFGRIAGRAGFDRNAAFEAMIETILVSMISSKIVGLAVSPGGDLSLRSIVQTGGIWYAGFLTGVIWFAWRGRRLGMKTLQGLDLAAPAVAVGHAIGRIGCFFAGCCWGRACELPWAVTFTDEKAARVGVPLGVPLHPTQLYEAAAEGVMAALLIALVLRQRYRFHGLPSVAYLLLYGALRFTLEFLRADPRGGLGPVSTSQAVALVVIAVALAGGAIGLARGTLDLGRPPVPGGDAREDRAKAATPRAPSRT